jgi:lactoylglutathione lyase
MDIKLIVVRTSDIKVLADFYSNFGLKFEYHKHGNSPFHYSTTLGQTVLEIYPLTKSQIEPDKNLRLGFSVDNFDIVINKLKELGCKFSAEAVETDFGYMAVVEDPDGRKIELYKK